MKYYRLYNDISPEIIGSSPNVCTSIFNYNVYEENSSYHLNFSKSKKDTLWPISKLAPKAKKTDLIKLNGVGLFCCLLVSEKLKSIFDNFVSEGVEFIKSKLILKNGNEEKYWITNPYNSNYKFLDIKKSKFFFTNAMGDLTFEEVKFSSIDEFAYAVTKNKKEAVEIGYPNFKPLVIKHAIFYENCNIDFCSIDRVYGGIGFFVSERLKNEIESAGCTGIVFTDPNEIYP